MTRVHVVAPTRAPAPAVLPDFVTDVRPPAPGPEHRATGRAAELGGLSGVLVPFDPGGHDALVLAAAVLRDTRRIGVTVEFSAAAATPVYAAKLSASLQRYHAGRLAWWLAVDQDPAVARAHGDVLTGPARYERADEFLTIARGVWSGRGYSREGAHFAVLDGGLPDSRVARPFPRVWLSGTSPEALDLSARHADVHVLAPGDDPALVPDGVAAAVRLPFAGDAGAFTDQLRAYEAHGVTEFVVDPADPVADAYRLAEHVLPRLAKETGHAG
ncbi:Alkanesulfonate monooxygenase [Actinomadura rubteroloni]|uniref:Alkanesulfonate monooxygenase n=1 Tax=Actinomadura rubteroloni TaxID=1926885 RepID=A0A2P4UQ76_9ACTN|nr:LLM class flavin-dependent oxidoreductase [Actinomadura rubteroloni]POM27190.1 Alkanesulfonate monooxygenase [Actinomadura rubteroloni]